MNWEIKADILTLEVKEVDLNKQARYTFIFPSLCPSIHPSSQQTDLLQC